VEETIPRIERLIESEHIEGVIAGSRIYSFRFTAKGRQKRELDTTNAEYEQKRSQRLLQSQRVAREKRSSEELTLRCNLQRHVFDQRALFWYSRFIVIVRSKLEENRSDWIDVGKKIGMRTAYSKIEGGSWNRPDDTNAIAPYQEILGGHYWESERIGTIETVHRILSAVDDLCEANGKDKIRNELINLRLCPLASEIVSYRAAAVFLRKNAPMKCDLGEVVAGSDKAETFRPLHLLEMACILHFFCRPNCKEPLTDEAAKSIVSAAAKDMETIGVTGHPDQIPNVAQLVLDWENAYLEVQEIFNRHKPGGLQ
jgi:hypothetical protein